MKISMITKLSAWNNFLTEVEKAGMQVVHSGPTEMRKIWGQQKLMNSVAINIKEMELPRKLVSKSL